MALKFGGAGDYCPFTDTAPIFTGVLRDITAESKTSRAQALNEEIPITSDRVIQSDDEGPCRTSSTIFSTVCSSFTSRQRPSSPEMLAVSID